MPWYDEMIEEVSAGFSRQDFGALRPWVHPDIVFDFSRSINDIRGVYTGIDQMEPASLRFFEPWAELEWEITSVEELDPERLVVVTRVVGRGSGSGIEIEATGAQAWQHRDRRLTRVTMYQSREEALEGEGKRSDEPD